MRGGIKPVAASVALALTWALGTDPGLESASPLGPASAHAGAEAGPPAARSLRLGDEAVTRRDYAAADALYRVALSVPAHREVASSRLHALHDLGAFDLSADEPQLRELEGWLGPRFRRYETEHFVVLSDAGRQGALARGRTMERARHQFFRVMERLGFPVVPPKNKLVCVFFERHQDYAAFAKTRDNVDTGWIAGYYTGLGNRVVFYDDATSPRFLQARDAIRQYHATLEDARERATDARRGRDRESADRLGGDADDPPPRAARAGAARPSVPPTTSAARRGAPPARRARPRTSPPRRAAARPRASCPGRRRPPTPARSRAAPRRAAQAKRRRAAAPRERR